MMIMLKQKVQCHLQYQNQCLEVLLLILNCKYAEETSNCTAAWKFIVMAQNVQCWRKQKELLLNGEN